MQPSPPAVSVPVSRFLHTLSLSLVELQSRADQCSTWLAHRRSDDTNPFSVPELAAIEPPKRYLAPKDQIEEAIVNSLNIWEKEQEGGASLSSLHSFVDAAPVPSFRSLTPPPSCSLLCLSQANQIQLSKETRAKEVNCLPKNAPEREPVPTPEEVESRASDFLLTSSVVILNLLLSHLKLLIVSPSASFCLSLSFFVSPLFISHLSLCVTFKFFCLTHLLPLLLTPSSPFAPPLSSSALTLVSASAWRFFTETRASSGYASRSTDSSRLRCVAHALHSQPYFA